MIWKSFDILELKSLFLSDTTLYHIINSIISYSNINLDINYILKDNYYGFANIRQIEQKGILEHIFKDNKVNYNSIITRVKTLFTIDGENIRLNKSSFKSYIAQCNYVHPYFLAGIYLANLYMEDRININNLEIYCNNLTSLLIDYDSNKFAADNHIHLNGALDPTITLMNLCHSPLTYERVKEIDKKIPVNKKIYKKPSYYIGVIQFLLNRIHSKSFIKNIFNKEQTKLLNEKKLEAVKQYNDDEELQENLYFKDFLDNGYGLYNFSKAGYTSIYKAGFKPEVNSELQAYVNIYYKAYYYFSNKEYNKAFFLYIIWFYLCYNHSIKEESTINIHYEISALFYAFNILRSFMVMNDTTGLESFATYFDSSVRDQPVEEQDTIQNLLNSGVTHIDYKHTGNFKGQSTLLDVNSKFKNDYKYFSKGISKFILNNRLDLYPNNTKLLKYGILPYETKDFSFHSSFHFIKESCDLDNIFKKQQSLSTHKYGLEIVYYKTARNKYKSICNKIINWLLSRNNLTSLYKLYKKDLVYERLSQLEKEILENTYIDIRHMLRSIDAAGDEIKCPPEIFAPYTRLIRESCLKRVSGLYKDLYTKSISPLIYSFHAGEDFSYILTGLRRIDETVRFLDYTRNDRIGHGLALGISPFKFIEKRRDIYTTVGDRYDDLIWLHHYAVKLNSPIANKLEQKAALLARKLYPELYKSGSWHIHDAYKSWFLRKNEPVVFFNNHITLNEPILAPDKDEYIKARMEYEKLDQKTADKDNMKNYYIMYQNHVIRNMEYHNIYNHKFYLAYNKPFYSCSDDVYSDTITDEELYLIEEVQDYLITTYADKGIVIETAPTSNVYISVLDEYYEHPLFRFHPPDMDMIQDKGIFNKYGRRKGILNVCINTDDPEVMPTSLHGEYKLIKDAALEYYNCDDRMVEDWCNKLMEDSLATFHNTHKSFYIRSK